MKVTVSFNLEEDIVKRIEDFQKQNNLKSRSAALERMILAKPEIDTKVSSINSNKEQIKELIKEVISEMGLDTKEVVNVSNKLDNKIEIENEDIDNSLTDVFGSMPDDE